MYMCFPVSRTLSNFSWCLFFVNLSFPLMLFCGDKPIVVGFFVELNGNPVSLCTVSITKISFFFVVTRHRWKMLPDWLFVLNLAIRFAPTSNLSASNKSQPYRGVESLRLEIFTDTCFSSIFSTITFLFQKICGFPEIRMFCSPFCGTS